MEIIHMLGCARLPKHPFHTRNWPQKIAHKYTLTDNEAKKSFCRISLLFSRLDYKNAWWYTYLKKFLDDPLNGTNSHWSPKFILNFGFMYFAYVGTIMRSSVMQLFSSSQDNAADTYTSLFLFLFLWRPLCEKWDQSSAAEKLDNIGVQKVI